MQETTPEKSTEMRVDLPSGSNDPASPEGVLPTPELSANGAAMDVDPGSSGGNASSSLHDVPAPTPVIAENSGTAMVVDTGSGAASENVHSSNTPHNRGEISLSQAGQRRRRAAAFSDSESESVVPNQSGAGNSPRKKSRRDFAAESENSDEWEVEVILAYREEVRVN